MPNPYKIVIARYEVRYFTEEKYPNGKPKVKTAKFKTRKAAEDFALTVPVTKYGLTAVERGGVNFGPFTGEACMELSVLDDYLKNPPRYCTGIELPD